MAEKGFQSGDHLPATSSSSDRGWTASFAASVWEGPTTKPLREDAAAGLKEPHHANLVMEAPNWGSYAPIDRPENRTYPINQPERSHIFLPDRTPVGADPESRTYPINQPDRNEIFNPDRHTPVDGEPQSLIFPDRERFDPNYRYNPNDLSQMPGGPGSNNGGLCAPKDQPWQTIEEYLQQEHQ